MKKIGVLHQPARQEEYHPPSISTEQSTRKAVHQFSYLECVIKSDDKIDKEVDNRLAKANSAFVRIYKRMQRTVYKATTSLETTRRANMEARKRGRKKGPF